MKSILRKIQNITQMVHIMTHTKMMIKVVKMENIEMVGLF